MRFFATCPRGLEALLADDARSAGASEVREVGGGVAWQGDWAACYRLNLQSRVATRVLLEIAAAAYAHEDDIYRLARAQPWGDWFAVERRIRVGVTAIRSPLKSLEFVTLRIKDGVCDRFRADCGKRPDVDTRDPEIRIHAFLSESNCTLYLDTSGEPLYQRGLRQKSVDAPLKENLAAGMLRLAGWQPGDTLLDPMCGGGTILLEAAQMALKRAPGIARGFAFTALHGYDHLLWSKVLDAARQGEQPVAALAIHGSDKDARAYRAALANLDRAGLLSAVQLEQSDLLERDSPAIGASGHAVMLANPPYGVRLDELDALAAFYPRLGQVLKQKYAGWTCCLLSADTRLPKLVGLRPSRKTPLFNGAIECRLYAFEMVAGSNRRKPRDAA